LKYEENKSMTILSMAVNCHGVEGLGEGEHRSVIVEAFT